MPKERPSSISSRIYFGCLLALPVVLYLIPIRWITDGGPTICLFKNITGHACYGCGITRAIFSLLHFEFATAFAYNKLVVVVAPMLLYLYIKEVLKTRKRL